MNLQQQTGSQAFSTMQHGFLKGKREPENLKRPVTIVVKLALILSTNFEYTFGAFNHQRKLGCQNAF
jgi:hypothetical protein